MNILAVLSQKGGTGKSTLVRSLAVAGILDKRKVAMIDADPQGTVVAWGKRGEHTVPYIVALPLYYGMTSEAVERCARAYVEAAR